MKNIKHITIASLILLLINSCSYQNMNSKDQKKFYIQEFDITGDTRTSFIIQKKIQRFSNKDSNNRIKLSVELDKSKSIEEKNIQNKVTKYRLTLSANVKIIELDSNKEIKRTFFARRIYNVEDNYSATINNSKDANNSLIDIIVDEILDQLRIYYN
tara:strand:+ start:1182 stop:1652 length:471 start_codon:yes stop_codon:yes gene_type:complete